MRMSIRLSAGLLTLALSVATPAIGHGDAEKLPPGPIKDRIELMEGIGDDAKAINDALKANKPADAAAPAERIADAVPKFMKMFPEGSISDDSRAKPNIWTSRDEFDAFSTYLEKEARALAVAAREGGDVKDASKKLWKSCKSCHQKFRKPKEGEEE